MNNEVEMDDPYIDLIDKNWDHIIMMYDTFKEKRPIIEFEINSKKIYSYPAGDYIQSLTKRTRNRTKEQHGEAIKDHQFLLFVKDIKNKKLRSYIFDLPDHND